MAVNLDDHYSDPTYMSDASVALNALLATEQAVYVPPKPFKFDAPITIVRNGQSLKGDGVFSNDMLVRNANLPAITVRSGRNGVEIEGLHLKRSVPATAGGNGIEMLGGQSNCKIRRCYIQDQWDGLRLLSGERCAVEDCDIVGGYQHGVSGTNTTFAWAWNFDKTLIAKCEGSGIFFVASNVAGAPAVCPVGRMRDLDIFAVSRFGVVIIGLPTVNVTNIDMQGGFIGSTGRDGVYLDTHEGYHNIADIKFEQVGVDATGRNWTTPASMQGNAISILGSNKDVTISNVSAFNTAFNGISNQADLTITGGRIENSGIAGSAGQRCGVASFAGRTQITGLRARNTGAGASQQYGVWAQNGASLSINGAWGLSGTIAGYAATTNAGSINVC